MTRLTFFIADELAQQAKAAGLLEEKSVEALLRRALRERAASKRLGEVLAKLDATGEPPLSDTEVADEITSARREHARRR